MGKIIRTEWIKLRYNLILVIIFVVIIFLSIMLADGSFKTLPEWFSMTPGFMNGMEMSKGEFVFRRVISDSSFPAWFSVFFAALFIGSEFMNRSINQEIFAGNSRFQIFAVKAAEFYLAGILISSIYPVISCLKYSVPWLQSLQGQELQDLFRCIFMKIVLDMGTMSFSLIAVFLFRDIIKSMGVALVFTIMLSRILTVISSLDNSSVVYKILSLYPASQYIEVMNPIASGRQIGAAMLVSCLFIFFSVAVSFLLFSRAELS